MLERLAGRIKWERMDDGIRVEMPGTMDRRNIPYSLLRIVLIASLYFILASLLDWWNPFNDSHRIPMRWVMLISAALVYGVSECVRVSRSKTVLTLTPSHLAADESRSPATGSREIRTFKTASLNHLRFVRYSPETKIRSLPGMPVRIDLRQNEIQFDRDFITYAFGTGITQEEANALIARMMEIYPFPNSPPPA